VPSLSYGKVEGGVENLKSDLHSTAQHSNIKLEAGGQL